MAELTHRAKVRRMKVYADIYEEYSRKILHADLYDKTDVFLRYTEIREDFLKTVKNNNEEVYQMLMNHLGWEGLLNDPFETIEE